MTLLDAHARTGGCRAVNPVAKLGASALIAIPLVLTLDLVSAPVALVLELLLIPFAGLGWREFWARTWPVWARGAAHGAHDRALRRRRRARCTSTGSSCRSARGRSCSRVATLFRVLAIALPSVVLFATVDPTDLADGLGQVLRLPARFVLGALAGLRMVGLFLDDWRALELARRARGVADRGRIRRFLGMAFALLVLSIRRGSKLATAMEARGFGAPGRRTWARESTFGGAEWMLMAVGARDLRVAVAAAVARRARGTSSSARA